LAFAHDAIANGATILVNREVTGCEVGDDVTTISTERVHVRTRPSSTPPDCG
jgi:hypothetical protein